MASDDTERLVVELRRLSAIMCQHLDDGEVVVHDINARLNALASLRPNWDITLVADILLHHQRESRSDERRMLSAAVRVPGGVSVCLWQDHKKSAIPICDGRGRFIGEPKFLPFADAPPLVRRLVLPLIHYTLENLCDRLDPQI